MNISEINPEKKNEKLLDRAPPEGYTQELTEIYSKEADLTTHRHLIPYFIFSLNNEWFGIDVKALKEVVNQRVMHKIPRRSNSVLKGTVNIEGQFKLVVSLKSFFNNSRKDATSIVNSKITKMVVLKQGDEDWVIEIEEILGIRYLDLQEMQNSPMNVLSNNGALFKGIIYVDEKCVGILEEETLFQSLKRSVL